MEKFIEGIKVEVEDGFINNRGFYTTQISWKWNYLKHFGFDKLWGRYDEYDVYKSW